MVMWSTSCGRREGRFWGGAVASAIARWGDWSAVVPCSLCDLGRDRQREPHTYGCTCNGGQNTPSAATISSRILR